MFLGHGLNPVRAHISLPRHHLTTRVAHSMYLALYQTFAVGQAEMCGVSAPACQDFHCHIPGAEDTARV